MNALLALVLATPAAGQYGDLLIAHDPSTHLVSGVVVSGAKARCVFAARATEWPAKVTWVAGTERGEATLAGQGETATLTSPKGSPCGGVVEGTLKRKEPWRRLGLATPGAAILAEQMEGEPPLLEPKPDEVIAVTHFETGGWRRAYRVWPKASKAGWMLNGLRPILGPTRAASRHLGEPQSEERSEGWSADGLSFGVCSTMCASRVDNHRWTCSAATTLPGEGRKALRDVDPDVWALLALKSKGTGTWPAELQTPSSYGDACDWSLRLESGGAAARVTGGQGACFQPAKVQRSAGSAGRLAAYLEFSGDHGCGERHGAVVSPQGITDAWVRRGIQLHLKKKYARAAKHYEAALKADPEHRKARYNLACAQALLGQAGPAVEGLKWLLQKDRALYRAKAAKDADFEGIRSSKGYLEAMGPDPVRLKGKLVHTPIERGRKSVSAWMGVEFRLDDRPVEPSSKVDREALLARAGQSVELRCLPGTAKRPHPMEQAPLGPDGQVMSRPARCAVIEVR